MLTDYVDMEDMKNAITSEEVCMEDFFSIRFKPHQVVRARKLLLIFANEIDRRLWRFSCVPC